LAEHSASRPKDLQILRQKLIGRASADPEYAALYRHLASMIDPYIDSFDEEPLSVDAPNEVFALVLDIARYAEDSVSRRSADKSKRLTRSRQSN
jgi:hypothetical protein